MDHLATDELATCISYYVLYTSNDNSARHDGTQESHIHSADEPNDTSQSNQQQQQVDTEDGSCFWQNDEWTDLDLEHAKSVLDQAKDLCHISSSSLTPTNNKQHVKHTLNQGSHKSWDRFYKSHGTKFFHDRHYLSRSFPNEFANQTNQQQVVVEIGCGVGNNVFPLLERYPKWNVWGFDYSLTAVELLQRNDRYIHAHQDGRAHVHVWDITTPPPFNVMEKNSADLCLLLFCLSAVPPQEMSRAVQHVACLLKPNGVLLFRDYGRYDQAQLQLGTSRGKGLDDNWYVKHDGTRCYYFDLKDMKRIFQENAGLDIVELKYIRRIYTNRAHAVAADKKNTRRRVWVQGRFQKQKSKHHIHHELI